MTAQAPDGAGAGSGGAPGPGTGRAGGTVFFLSDFGLRDEFVGVVHAVLRHLAPGAVVVDLTHGIRPYDVRGGADALVRAVPHLGSGVVLAVVDPGVGSGRRGLAIEARGRAGPLWLVGPDNGLLIPAAEASGGVLRAVELGGDGPPAPGAPPHPGQPAGSRPAGRAGRSAPTSEDATGLTPVGSATFDGRDLFAPAAAALCNGHDLAELGRQVPRSELVVVPALVVERHAREGRQVLRVEVTWVDRFGNVQLAAAGGVVPLSAGPVAVAVLASPGWPPTGPGDGDRMPSLGPVPERPEQVARVRAFADLSIGELGLLADANGRLALVAREASAALRLGVGPGDLVELEW